MYKFVSAFVHKNIEGLYEENNNSYTKDRQTKYGHVCHKWF